MVVANKVIICLGCSFTKPSNVRAMEFRIQKAVELYLAGKAEKIIFSGGNYSRKDLSEAKYMSDLAVKLGVPKRDIILEEKSIETLENAKFSKAIIDKKSFDSAIIVSSPWHLPRVKFLFEKSMANKKLEFVAAQDKIGWWNKIKEYWREFWALKKLKKELNH